MYYIQIICEAPCRDFLKCKIVTEWISELFAVEPSRNTLKKRRWGERGIWEALCKGAANSRVWSFLQIRSSVVGGCRIFWDSLSTIRKSKKEKPEKSWKLEINAKSTVAIFFIPFFPGASCASDVKLNKDYGRQHNDNRQWILIVFLIFKEPWNQAKEVSNFLFIISFSIIYTRSII